MGGVSDRSRAVAILVGAALLLAACERAHVAAAPLQSSAAQPGEHLAPIKLDQIMFNLERGQQIGAYRESNFNLCGNSFATEPIYWDSGRIVPSDDDIAASFYRAMKSANYNLVGDPTGLFASYGNDQRSPEYLIGARVDSVTLDVCDEVNIGGRRLDLQSGLGGIAVTWQVFSTLEQQVVLETQTSGSTELSDGVPHGEAVMITRAFGVAAGNLAADPRFHALLSHNASAQPASAAALLSGWSGATAQPAMALPATAPFTTPIGANMARVQASVVTIFAGEAQGSGFLVAPDMVLTNHHVVRDAQRVKLVFVNGNAIYATILRSDPRRDVALLKVEGGPFTPLPLRMGAVAIAEEVYAVGSPLDPSLAGTVTRGIVSQVKTDDRGQSLIQADATIQPGSSGGPLLDARGNVIGISQSGAIDDTNHLVGLNFFIPIADALQRLGLVVN